MWRLLLPLLPHTTLLPPGPVHSPDACGGGGIERMAPREEHAGVPTTGGEPLPATGGGMSSAAECAGGETSPAAPAAAVPTAAAATAPSPLHRLGLRRRRWGGGPSSPPSSGSGGTPAGGGGKPAGAGSCSGGRPLSPATGDEGAPPGKTPAGASKAGDPISKANKEEDEDEDLEPQVSAIDALRTAWPWLLPRHARHQWYLAAAIAAQVAQDGCLFVRPLLLRSAMAGLASATAAAGAAGGGGASPAAAKVAAAAASTIPPIGPVAGAVGAPLRRRLTRTLFASSAALAAPALDAFSRTLLPSSPSKRPLVAIVGYIVTGYASGLLTSARHSWWGRAQHAMVRDLQLNTFAHLHGLSLGWHLNRNTSQVMRVFFSGVRSVTELLQLCSLQFLPIITSFAMNVAVLWRLGSWHLSALAVVSMAIYSALMYLSTRWSLRRMSESFKEELREAGRAMDSLHNFEAVKTFATEPVEVRRYGKSLTTRHRRNRSTFRSILLRHGKSAVESIFMATGLVIAGRRVMEGTLSVADFVACQSYLNRIFAPVAYAAYAVRSWHSALLSLRKLVDVHNQQPSVMDEPEAPPLVLYPTPTSRGGRVVFENVSFAYGADSAGALHDLSFTVPAGGTTAIVGPTGAGKSTIMRLLLRLFDVSAGRITVDGQDVSTVTQSSLRKAIGVVPQDCHLLRSSVRDNIAYGRDGGDDVSDEDVMAAAEVAQLTDWIRRLPKGLDSVCGERGVRLSGGERQRVGIARAVVRHAAVMLLDESSSSLDSETERAMQVALRRVSEGATTILVAHRLSTVIRANEILVLEGGRIIERGSHAKLLARERGRYRRMWDLQQGGGLDDGDADDAGWAKSADEPPAAAAAATTSAEPGAAAEEGCTEDEQSGASEENAVARGTAAAGGEVAAQTAAAADAPGPVSDSEGTTEAAGEANGVGATDTGDATDAAGDGDAAHPSNGVAAGCEPAARDLPQPQAAAAAAVGTQPDGVAVGGRAGAADAAHETTSGGV